MYNLPVGETLPEEEGEALSEEGEVLPEEEVLSAEEEEEVLPAEVCQVQEHHLRTVVED
jgi:hypothetical protein